MLYVLETPELKELVILSHFVYLVLFVLFSVFEFKHFFLLQFLEKVVFFLFVCFKPTVSYLVIFLMAHTQ